jgi:hypothetical protein
MKSCYSRRRSIAKVAPDRFVNGIRKFAKSGSLSCDTPAARIIPGCGKGAGFLVPFDSENQFHLILMFEQQLDRSAGRFCPTA